MRISALPNTSGGGHLGEGEMMDMTFCWIVIVPCTVLVLFWVLRRIAESRNFQFFGTIVSRVDTKRKVVALTFDDGPNPPYTDRILSILRDYSAKATFFVLGKRLEEHPATGQRMVDEGHEIANHSYSHKYLLLRPPRTIREEILRAEAAIRKIAPESSTLFRPPFGKKLLYLTWFLKKMGKTTIMCDVDAGSAEFVSRNPWEITEIILGKVRPGSIIMLHDGGDDKRHVVEAVQLLAAELTSRGYQMTSVSELLKQAARW
jgi:peptidoglycan/xylan/chitin deacetylase (PgdA/CDA1 family)